MATMSEELPLPATSQYELDGDELHEDEGYIEDVISHSNNHNHHNDEIEQVIAAHRSLHRFMTTLLYDCQVSALDVIVLQDNASILTKKASLSARAAHERLALGGRDHMIITKEISRWESYPFEVNKPIVVTKPKRAKNGCVPQRRAKRRSGLESAGEIKADILKKAESLPRRPRRRSSVATDEAQKTSIKKELLSLFDDDDTTALSGNSSSTAAGTSSSTSSSFSNSVSNAAKPKRDVSPLRYAMIPKKPTRRPSELPEDLTTTNPRNSSRTSTLLSDLMGDSMHSVESTETTLSEIASRQSDLSSISEQTSELLTTLAEHRALDCSVIHEEEENHPQQPHLSAGKKQPQSQQSIPRKPVRRVSEVPPPDNRKSSPTHARTQDGAAAATPQSTKPRSQEEELPSLTVMESPSVDLDNDPLGFDEDEDEDYNDVNQQRSSYPAIHQTGDYANVNPRWAAEDRKVSRTESMPTHTSASRDRTKVARTESMPKKPTRRVSEVPYHLVSAGCSSPTSSRGVSPVRATGNNNEAQHSFSTTESTASETTVASDVEEAGYGAQPVELCAVIPEED